MTYSLLSVTLLETGLYTGFVLCYTVLRRIELEMLAAVKRSDTIFELATKLGHSESSLASRHGPQQERSSLHGTRRSLEAGRPSDIRAVEIYQNLVRQHSHIDFSELLTGKALKMLYYLD